MNAKNDVTSAPPPRPVSTDSVFLRQFQSDGRGGERVIVRQDIHETALASAKNALRVYLAKRRLGL